MSTIPNLVERLITMHGGNTALAAERLGSSVASLSRYRAGDTRPRRIVEERLRHIVDGMGDDLVSQSRLQHDDQRLSALENAIASTLNALREEFHRTASISNRQDVLDLVAVLVFAHVTSIDKGGLGLGSHLLSSSKTAVDSVNAFVQSALAKHLPDFNGYGPDPSRLFTEMTMADERFCNALLSIFERDAAAFRELHNIGHDDLINDVFSRFMATSFVDEKEMGQYLTPPEVTRFMVQVAFESLDTETQQTLLDPDACAEVGPILDPSCGVGSFLAESVRFLHSKVRERNPEKAGAWLERFVSTNVIGIDKSDRMLRLASFNLGMFGVQTANLFLANGLAREGSDSKVTLPLEGKAHIILTNPPFGATYTGDDLACFAIAHGKSRVASEVLFLERYIDWVAPGGVIASVVPDSVLVNRAVFSELREWLRSKCDVVAVFSLPPVTFAAAGTSTKTSILVLRRQGSKVDAGTFFGEIRDVGYDVNTRSGQRRRIRHGKNDMPALFRAFSGTGESNLGRWSKLPKDALRWDAGFHASADAKCGVASRVVVSDVADLADERCDPKNLGVKSFDYIEIGDVDGKTGLVGHKHIPVNEAPSRARKRVKAGDVLVSTVRPERGTIGVVPTHLDGAVCSTGFAVVRCHTIHPIALAWLLRTEAVRRQMIRHNIGIAYPAIADSTCLELQLPVDAAGIEKLAGDANALERVFVAFEEARAAMARRIELLGAT
jgi:N-6 DNA Methylase